MGGEFLFWQCGSCGNDTGACDPERTSLNVPHRWCFFAADCTPIRATPSIAGTLETAVIQQ